MEIRAEQLSQSLKKLAPLYLVSGDEVLLVQEACDQIRKAAKEIGYQEREIFTITNQFKWQDFFESIANFSLFGDKKIIELRFDQKPNRTATEALTRYCEQTSEQTFVLIITPKLEAATKKSGWYKTLVQTGHCLAIWPINKEHLPTWLATRFKASSLQVEPAVIQLICERVEGNLLAAQQEIEKLTLQYGSGPISAEQILQNTSDNYRYDVFALVDSCLQGSIDSINKILISLKEEGIEAILVLWALVRELRNAIKIIEALNSGQNLDVSLQKAGIWDKQKPLWRKFLNRCKSLKDLYSAIQLAATIDQQIKGIQKGNPWETLLVLCLNFAGKRVD
ncbi:MAG: DNA polymerase III subunit delta [Gammaproteobacteria bacterium RIFCSPHIGHO2_12_FULL_35_23]|nr:MAG: DNA polymerase III subunit delta [Gammaproteobacteria bacterium RIFCSPHIGHO2_12_FULL_35_23]